MEYFDAHAQGFGKTRGAEGNDHELLQVDGIVGVRAAIQNIHHGHGQQPRACASQIAIERRAPGCRCRARGGQRNGQDRIGAQTALIRRAIEIDHDAIDGGLLRGFVPVKRRGDFLAYVSDRIANALAEIARLIAIAQLDGFMLAGRSAGGHGGLPPAAVGEKDFSFHGRVPAGIQDFDPGNFCYRCQEYAPCDL